MNIPLGLALGAATGNLGLGLAIGMNLPDDHQGMFDPGNDEPEVLLDENGEPVVDEDSDEDMFDSINDR